MPPISRDQFARLTEEAIASLPKQFAPYMENVTVEVRDLPPAELLDSLSLAGDKMLLGVYRGVPITKKSIRSPVDWPGRVLIFQRNIEAACTGRSQIVRMIRKTVLHEVGHHFGLDEANLARLGYG